MTTTEEVMCPKCGGKTWDNRDTKRNPKAPDYKCRDKACDGAVWPPKGAVATTRPAAAPSSTAKVGYSAGGPLPWEGEKEDTLPHEKLDAIFRVYNVCMSHAHKEATDRFGNDVADDTVAAMTATLLIAAQKAGVV